MGRRASGKITLSGKGYYRWYKGRTRWVCGKDTPAAEVEDRWIDLKRHIDGQGDGRPPSESTVRELISDFITACRRRVETGKPKSLSPRMLHNYITDLNEFGKAVGGGTKVEHLGPRHFDAYAGTIATMKRSGYDSKVAHVQTLIRWAVANEYIDKARYGTAFARPGKQAIRDERVVTGKSFTAAEVAKLIDHASGAMRVMLMLGICAAMNNSEVAWLERACVDLDTGVLDFRRRKSGRVRRVIPLPADVAAELRAYVRPEPKDAAHAGLFFLTEEGNPYVRMTAGGQANTVTKLFRDLADACGVKDLEKPDGRGFAGLRASFGNMAPVGYRDEVEIVMGHAKGTILKDHYLETHDLDRLRHVVMHVWTRVQKDRSCGQRQAP